MLTVRRAGDRGTTRLDWLDSRHTFSFGEYHDPRHMGFGALRVINDDRVAPGGGFGTHSHRDMEIVTYVLDGALEHRDSLGTGSVIRPGDVQKMSAGTGIQHSEFNHSRAAPVHFLQIWVIPRTRGLAPGYQQLNFPRESKIGEIKLVASGQDRGDVIGVAQDVEMYASILESPRTEVVHQIATGRHAWLHVADGGIAVDGLELGAGDGAAIDGPARLVIRSAPAGEILLFDLA
jgi:quercetin 2,3-dioxygenase